MQHIFKNGIFNRVELLISSITDYLITFLSLIASIIYIGIINIYLLFVAFGVIGVGLVLIIPFNQRAKQRRKKSKDIQMEFDRLFVKRIMSKREILQNQQFEREAQQDDNLNNIWL
jgi:hypothetical protein